MGSWWWGLDWIGLDWDGDLRLLQSKVCDFFFGDSGAVVANFVYLDTWHVNHHCLHHLMDSSLDEMRLSANDNSLHIDRSILLRSERKPRELNANPTNAFHYILDIYINHVCRSHSSILQMTKACTTRLVLFTGISHDVEKIRVYTVSA